MALQQFRVVYRRRGNKAEQSRTFGQWPKATAFASLLDRPELLPKHAKKWLAPIEVCYIQSRSVGPWKTVANLMDDL
jgi:hypothetical protein